MIKVTFFFLLPKLVNSSIIVLKRLMFEAISYSVKSKVSDDKQTWHLTFT